MTDDDLIRATYAGNTSDVPRFSVVYLDGTKIHVAAKTTRDARVIGREYGTRFLGGARVAGIERVDQ